MAIQEMLEKLNPQQQAIVRDTEGRILALAGAGSGKTSVLTHRIAYLVEACGIRPWNILAVTFTNKAAKEMKERLVKLIGEPGRDVWIGTFHGTCVRILSRFGEEVGLTNNRFVIIDEKDQIKLLKEANELCGLDYDIGVVGSTISNLKNDLKSPDDARQQAKQQFEKDIANLYAAYEELKNQQGYIDFDDLITKTIQLLQVSEAARSQYQYQFQYVSVDEFQDTNQAQFKLLELLTDLHENLMYVGDSDQSIYRWRGANIQNIIGLQQRYPHLKTYRLEQNYRSTKTIVNAANKVIENNTERLEKEAFTDNEYGEPIILHRADHDVDEANYIAAVIKQIHQIEGVSYQDFTILYRANRQSRAIELALTQAGISYQTINGTSFYQRKEIKDIVGYLRSVYNIVDSLAFQRVINVPKRGIGDTTISRIQDYANDCNISFPKALEVVGDIPKISLKTKEKITDFVKLITELREFESSEDFTVLGLLQKILNETGYRASYETGKEDDATRLENLDELMNVAAKWDEANTEGKKLFDFLSETTLIADMDKSDDEQGVSLMTIHSAKGLENKYVFMIGLEEGVFPHGRSIGNPAEMEEERRLMYVAMTRAEVRLFISYCESRYEYGNPKPLKMTPSRFLEEIPEEYIKQI